MASAPLLSISTGCIAEIVGLKSREDLNGKQALVGKSVFPDRWAVTVLNVKEQMNLKPESLIVQLAPKCEVELCGLQSRADLNGKVAVVKQYNQETGRWAVELKETKEQMNAKPDSLLGPVQKARAAEAAQQAAAEEAKRKAAAEAAQLKAAADAAAAAARKAAEEAARKAEEEKKAADKKRPAPAPAKSSPAAKAKTAPAKSSPAAKAKPKAKGKR